MEKHTLVSGIAKLAMAGEQAGFTVEQMIQLLNAGLGVDALMDLIAWRLEQPKPCAPVPRAGSCESGAITRPAT
jgi:hypothetical protein